MPVTGHSFASVLADENAPATNRLQYFEMAGSRALVAEIDRWWKRSHAISRGRTTRMTSGTLRSDLDPRSVMTWLKPSLVGCGR